MNSKTIASFTWNYAQNFFVETLEGNFIWSDPDYEGDNKITAFEGSYKDWIKMEKIPYGRDKGQHTIEEFCGKDVIFSDKIGDNNDEMYIEKLH